MLAPLPWVCARNALQGPPPSMQEVVAIANRYPPYGAAPWAWCSLPDSRNVIPAK